MGRRNRRQRQKGLWVAAADLPQTAAHPFYHRLNKLLDEHGFDEFAEQRCQKFYAAHMGRPSLTPGSYFRCLLIGYFEGIDSERGIAWRLADSISLRRFLAIELDESTPDHSTISRTRRLIDVETHRQVFTWVLQLLDRPSRHQRSAHANAVGKSQLLLTAADRTGRGGPWRKLRSRPACTRNDRFDLRQQPIERARQRWGPLSKQRPAANRAGGDTNHFRRATSADPVLSGRPSQRRSSIRGGGPLERELAVAGLPHRRRQSGGTGTCLGQRGETGSIYAECFRQRSRLDSKCEFLDRDAGEAG